LIRKVYLTLAWGRGYSYFVRRKVDPEADLGGSTPLEIRDLLTLKEAS
jgi:hypothetical protein